MVNLIFKKPYKVSNGYGWRTHPVTGRKQFHNGVDFVCPVNTPILSPWKGVISTVFTHPTGGLSFRIRHENGYTTGYCHLKKVLFKKGQIVCPGEVVAYSGKSGRVTGPHLHFTLRKNHQTLIDPNKFGQ
jgi:murein DD-endopeptidase